METCNEEALTEDEYPKLLVPHCRYVVSNRAVAPGRQTYNGQKHSMNADAIHSWGPPSVTNAFTAGGRSFLRHL